MSLSIHKEDNFEIICTYVSSINVKIWDEKNRPPDQVKIQRFKDYYENNNVQMIPGIICIWKLNDEEMYIYDGLHRYLAANQSNNKQMKCIVKFFTGNQSDVISEYILTMSEDKLISPLVNGVKELNDELIYMKTKLLSEFQKLKEFIINQVK